MTATRTTVRRGSLTDRQVDAAKPREKDYKLSDGNSLFVLVKKSGAKLWRYKFYFAGKEKLMAFPIIGARPVDQIGAPELVLVVKSRTDSYGEEASCCATLF